MHQTIIKHLEDRFQSFAELADQINDAHLGEKLDVPNSKTLLTHMWCVIGARESYAVALKAGAWDGFNCSMSEFNVVEVRAKLAASAAAFADAIASFDTWTPEREELLASLMEHEVMHEGQIIRLWYALEHELPQSVKWA